MEPLDADVLERPPLGWLRRVLLVNRSGFPDRDQRNEKKQQMKICCFFITAPAGAVPPLYYPD